MLPHRRVYDEEHDQFRETVRRFAATKIAPDFKRWEEDGIIDRSLWDAGGAAGLLCPQVPEEFGGAGGDFRHNAVVIEELSYSGFAGPATDFSVHNDVCCGYLLSYGTAEQKKKWLPRMVTGETVCAIAMTEPGTGSDLQGIRTRALRDGNEFVISGQKTFIRHGRNLEKLGHLSSDTSELFFDGVRVPVSNLLGAEGGAMGALMSELPQERLTIALHSIAAAQKAFDLAKDYVQQRNAFGSPIGSFQNTRFKLADLKSDLAVGWAYADQCLHDHVNHELTTYAASTAKLWITEMHGRLVDQCLQFFGGYGFMREYEICRLYADARVLRIYGGTSEIMRELISRNL
jgi:acyl-CoA dehydrogenase